MTRLPLPILALLGLAACDPATTAAFAGLNLVTLVHSDKTVGDHAISMAADEDCSILYASRNETYCRKPAADGDGDGMTDTARLAASLYCYRTLGGVSCYDRPDYTASTQTRINFAHGTKKAPAAGNTGNGAPLAALPESGTY